MIKLDCGHQLALALGSLPVLISHLPAPHVMATGNDARPNPLGYPRAHDVVTNLSLYTQQIASANAEFRSMSSVNPERIGMRDFIQPLGIGAARMNLHRQAKS